MKPLEKAAKRVHISGGEPEVKSVFGSLKSLLQFHTTFLSMIRDKLDVVETLCTYINFIQMYQDYLHRYDEILNTFGSWKSLEFREFITMRLRNPNVKKKIIDRLDSLPWYLYRPFDRIKEYHRFLKDLQKVTGRENENYQHVKKSIAKIRPLYKRIKSSFVYLMLCDNACNAVFVYNSKMRIDCSKRRDCWKCNYRFTDIIRI